MKKLISVSVILLMSTPAYANLSWSTSTTWPDDAIKFALTSVNADDATIRNFNARWRAMTNKTVNGAYMGALYAASLDGDITPVAAVDAGYDFMQKLLSARENADNKPVSADDIDDVQSDTEIPADEPVAADDIDDVQSDTEVSADEPANDPVADDNTPLTDGDIAAVKAQLTYLLDSRCANMNVIKNSTDMSGGSVPANLNCTRVAPDKNVFRCEYSRTYTLQGKQYVCKTASAFNVNFGKGGHFTGDADKAYLEVVASDNRRDSKINTEQNESTQTIITDINRAEKEIEGWGRLHCGAAVVHAGEYQATETDVKCESRENNIFVCRCRYVISQNNYPPRTCTISYTGKIYANAAPDGRFSAPSTTMATTLGGDINVQPMPTPKLESNVDIIKRVEPTKKEQRQAARNDRKELREIEKREKKGLTDNKTPAYVAPLTDETIGDLGPDMMDDTMREIMDFDSYVSSPAKKEKTKLNKETKKSPKANKKNKDDAAPAAPLPPRASVPEPDYLEQDLYTTTMDIL